MYVHHSNIGYKSTRNLGPFESCFITWQSTTSSKVSKLGWHWIFDSGRVCSFIPLLILCINTMHSPIHQSHIGETPLLDLCSLSFISYHSGICNGDLMFLDTFLTLTYPPHTNIRLVLQLLIFMGKFFDTNNWCSLLILPHIHLPHGITKRNYTIDYLQRKRSRSRKLRWFIVACRKQFTVHNPSAPP